MKTCCHKCIDEEWKDVEFSLYNLPYNLTHMIVCPTCGNKRCPKASDHELECTNSNEPGQPGSVYGNKIQHS